MKQSWFLEQRLQEASGKETQRLSSLTLLSLPEQVSIPKAEVNYGYDDVSEALGQ